MTGVLLLDAWGGTWENAPGGGVGDNPWALTWTYDINLQPVTSAGVGGQAAKSHPGRRRFFPYPNVIDDGNAIAALLEEQMRIRRQAPKKRPAPDVAEPDESDETIMRMRQVIQHRLAQPPPQPAAPERDEVMDKVREMLARRQR